MLRLVNVLCNVEPPAIFNMVGGFSYIRITIVRYYINFSLYKIDFLISRCYTTCRDLIGAILVVY